MVLSSRTYILSANTRNDFDQWLAFFYHPVYEGILVESNGWKQSHKKRSYKRASYKQRYLVLTEYQQIRVYNDEQRHILFEIMNLRDVHSFNIENVVDKKSPTSFLLELNASKSKKTLCFESKSCLRLWCRALSEKLKLKTAENVGRSSIFGRSSFVKRDTTFYSDDERDDQKLEENPHRISTHLCNALSAEYFTPKMEPKQMTESNEGAAPQSTADDDNMTLTEGQVQSDEFQLDVPPKTMSHLDYSLELVSDVDVGMETNGNYETASPFGTTGGSNEGLKVKQKMMRKIPSYLDL